MNVSNEFKVGLFALVAGGVVLTGYLWSYDGVRPSEASYALFLTVPNADGLYRHSPLKVAGVEVGSIESIEIVDDRALIMLTIRAQYRLPVDTTAEIRASGLLGDRYIQINPGLATGLLKDGDVIELRAEPGDIDRITAQVQTVTEDIAAITKVVREIVEDRQNRDHVEATLANIDALTESLRLTSEQNRGDINAIVDSVRRLTESLEGYTSDVAGDIDVEMQKLQDATDTLQSALTGIESVALKIDAGQGTLGALVNDSATIDALNETIENANAAIESFTGMHAEVYYTHRYYFGSRPPDTETFFFGNPRTGGSNNIGMLLMPQEDFWWIFEINDNPMGTVTYTERYLPSLGEVYTEWTREPNYRFTFMMSKRWFDFSLRLGVKESGGGLGATWYLLRDRLRLEADVFDFTVGSYPAVQDSGIPNTRLGVFWEPVDHIYFTAGTEQVLLGLKHDFFTGFVGGGFHFTDDDIKLLFATLPLPF